MGLFGGGNSKSTSTSVSEDNSVINDYANAAIDNSVDASTSLEMLSEMDGSYNNNTGTINVTSGSAFDVVKDAISGALGTASTNAQLADNAISSSAGLSSEAFALTNSLNQTNAGLSSEAFALTNSLNQTNAG